jgi:hypothetical protein
MQVNILPEGEIHRVVSSTQMKRIAEKPTLSTSGHAGQTSIHHPAEQLSYPRVGQRVFVAGQKEEYIVMRVDRERYLADVMCMTGTKRVEKGVLLVALSPIPPEKSRRVRLGPILRKDN